MLSVIPAEEALQAADLFGQDLCAERIPRIDMSLLRLHQQIALCIPDGFALRREQCHCIFAGQMLGGFFQRGGFLGGKPDGVMVIKDADACAECQCPAGKCSEITLDALCCFQNIVPCAHKEYIIAAGIDDAYMQAL